MAGEITLELLDELGARLEDAGGSVFPKAWKLVALNRAQYQVAQLLNTGYLGELETSETGLNVSSGSYSISSLNSGNGVFKGGEGIIAVSVDPGNTGNYKFATYLPVSDIKQTANSLYSPSDTYINYYVFGNKVYILCSTYTNTKAKIYYLRKPENMSSSVDPTLNKALHPLICTYAESLCWSLEGKHDRRQAAYDLVMLAINVLNSAYRPPEGIGTIGREYVKR